MPYKCFLIGTAVVLISLFTCTPFDLSSAAGEKNITVTLGKESYQLMESIDISWFSDFEVPSVQVELWKDNRALEILAEELETDSYSTWSVHSGLESGEDYTIRVISSVDPTLYGESDLFIIDIAYFIQVTMDAGRYVMYEHPSIAWSADIMVDEVKLELWSGDEFIETLTDLNTTGDFANWQIHQEIAYGTEYTVRAVSLADETILGESRPFTILTYLVLGGNGYDYAGDIDIDPSGNIYLCGSNNSTDIAGTNPSGEFDFLVYKLSADGRYASGFDGDGRKMVPAVVTDIWESEPPTITIDSSQNVYCAGSDYQSGYFEYTAVRLSAHGTLDIGFDIDGQRLIYGGGHDVCSDIVLDKDDSSCYLLGRSGSTDGNYSGETLSGTSDACIIKLISDGSHDGGFSSEEYAGVDLIGGNASDAFYTGDIDPDDGSIFAAGSSRSTDLAGYNGGSDFFIAKIKSNGDPDTAFSTDGMALVGESGDEFCWDIFFADESGDKKLYLTGASDSIDISGIQIGVGTNDFLAVKLNASDGTPDNSFSDDSLFRFGGNGDDRAKGICTYNNKIYTAGWSESTDITNEVDKGGRDIIILRLNMDGTIDTSFHGNGILTIGGNSVDTLNKAVFGPDGNLYLAATTASTDIPGQPINGFYDFLLIAIKP